jgi:type I restriction enzyme M protein
MDRMPDSKSTKKPRAEVAKTSLTTLFSYCLDVLRNNEHLTGDKALRTLAHLLDLRLLEQQFGTQIDIDNYDYDFSSYEDEVIEKHRAKLLNVVRFSNLALEKEENLPIIMKCLWDEVLSVHPVTKNIFVNGKGFDIQHQSTYRKLIQKLYAFDFASVDEDILGEAYEEVIKDVMTGKVLGQFFTPPKVKQMMIKLVDPQVKTDGTIETIFDPAMGTGGFLISSLRHLLRQSQTRNIGLDWSFISNEGLGGREAEPDTYQLAISNMLISSGHMFRVLEMGDSIRDPITKKYDIILANPPFGIDGLIYNDITHPLRNEYMPIKSNSAVPLFLQAIIHMLNINGRCAVVLPNGKELFSTSKELVSIREYLLKTCNLKEVIYLPSGIFTHTSIKTCVLYFIKLKEGADVLQTKVKYSKKNQKEMSRHYTFMGTHQTNIIRFYNYNTKEDVKELISEVNIKCVSENGYSLNYTDYTGEDKINHTPHCMVAIKTLEEVCTFDIGGTPSRSKPEYYENGTNLWVSVRELNGGYIYDTREKINDLGVTNSNVKLYDIGTILFSFKLSIGKTAIVGTPLYSNEAIAGIKSKDSNVLDNMYLYYYLTNTDFSQAGSGMLGHGSLNKKTLGKIKILIPSIEQQKDIVRQMDVMIAENQAFEQRINENIRKTKLIMSSLHKNSH